MAEVVAARPEHATTLALTMRAEDRAEVMASGGHTPLQALQESLAASTSAWTLIIGGEAAAMFGLVPREPGVALVWLLSGEAVSRYPRAFLRICRPVVESMNEAYPVLVNAVDARYGAALRWAEWLGFEVGEPEPFGIAGEMFRPIRRESWAR